MIAANAHDENGPSALERREGCPGSRAAEAGLPHTTSPAGERGHAIHGHIARLAAIASPTLADLDGIPADDLPVVEACLEQIQAAKAELGPTAIVLVEHRIDLTRLGIPLGGTIDCAVIIPGGKGKLIDHKGGVSYVRHPRSNRQIQAYAWGLVDSFALTQVDGIIVQPGAFSERQRVRSHLWTAPEILALGEELRAIVSRAQDPDAPLRVGEHCQWCRAKDHCQKRALVAAEVNSIADPVADLKTLSPLMRTAAYERLTLAIKVLEDAKEQVEAAAIAGEVTIPGYVVGEGKKGNREWTDADAAEAALRRACTEKGLDPDDSVERKVLSPSKAEKLLGKKDAARVLAGLVTQAPGKPALVRGEA